MITLASMTEKERILDEFKLYSFSGGGIGSWLTEATESVVFDRLTEIEKHPLSKAQLDQLLLLSLEGGVSSGFFEYYWRESPELHPFDVRSVPGFEERWLVSSLPYIVSREHLKWGLHRLYTDALLYFGDVRNAYRTLRTKSKDDLIMFFRSRRFDTAAIKARGPALPLRRIPKDDRYLISEMACKSYGVNPTTVSELKQALKEAWQAHHQAGGGRVTVRSLMEGATVKKKYEDRQTQLLFSVDGILEEEVNSESELDEKYKRVAELFAKTREAAVENTRFYLSMVNNLDVYVATSMRTRKDFRNMADSCEAIFGDPRLRQLELRYFDPTLSAAEGHEDKGLIECLMVKCAKALVYCAGEKESYGKDAEAAMALSLGKPVIFLCDHHQRSRFYREVHPLSRLINFESGVAVGAMVTDKAEDVAELLRRLFENKMEYELEQPKPGYLRLVEKLTRSVVRLQTNDALLAQTFWNYYHNRPAS